MTSKIYYNYHDIRHQTRLLARAMYLSNWTPDWIVGINRGGLVPALELSHWMKIPMFTLNVQLRDSTEFGTESNSWMAEAAFGYDYNTHQFEAQKRILIVDDINDSGATLNWIRNDWESGCYPDDARWEEKVWHHSTRFACLVDNANSDAVIDYSAVDIAKTDEYDPWIVFPWEVDD